MTSTLANLMSRAEVLLLDFDGPICSLFAGYPASVIADELRAIAASRGFTVTADGPLSLFREVELLGDVQLSSQIADALRHAEMKAVTGATPTPGADAVLLAARESRRRVAIVSNNSRHAVDAYLAEHRLNEHVDLVVGRRDQMPAQLLKPNPHLVKIALTRAHVKADAAVFVGDSVTDVEAGKAVSVATVGYANKPGKRARLTSAGAHAIIDTMIELAQSMCPPASTP